MGGFLHKSPKKESTPRALEIRLSTVIAQGEIEYFEKKYGADAVIDPKEIEEMYEGNEPKDAKAAEDAETSKNAKGAENRKTAKKAKPIGNLERIRCYREATWIWMFENRGMIHEIMQLRTKMESRKSKPRTTAEFSSCISEAHGHLSDTIDKYIFDEYPINLYVTNLTLTKGSSDAVTILLSVVHTHKKPSRSSEHSTESP